MPFGLPLARLNQASTTYRIATFPQAGRRIARIGGGVRAPGGGGGKPLCAEIAGFTLHAATRCREDDRRRLARLCRYVTRPAFADNQLRWDGGPHVSFELKTPWRDGTTHLEMSPVDFLERLAALVPRPRLHLVRFHGILGTQREAAFCRGAPSARIRAPRARLPRPGRCRADLLRRVYDIDRHSYPNCGLGTLEPIATILDPDVIARILGSGCEV